ncbi:MAG TPA: DMT family transporter [Elusimicrobiales bacterium]|nr:DMT family transporter [Elusimicrobiales bacterium]
MDPTRFLPGRKRLADIGLVYCAAVWGSTFFAVKGALASVDPVALVALRFLGAALLMLPLAARRAKLYHRLKEGFVLAVIHAALYLAQTVGLVYTSASNSGFITGLFIIFIPVLLFLLRGERPSPAQGVSAVLAMLGLWLLTGGIGGFNRGDMLTLAAAAAYAAHVVYTDKYSKAGADPVMLAFHQFWIIAVIAFALAWASGRPLAVSGAGTWRVLAFLAVFPTFTAFYVQVAAQKESVPFRVGLIFTLEPVFAAIFAWTLGGETFVPVKAVGGSLIVAGMLVSELGGLVSGRAAAEERRDRAEGAA